MSTVRIAVATSGDSGAHLNSDDEVLVDALESLGAEVDVINWRSVAQWASYDVVVVRSTWDYHDHHDEFVAWVDEVHFQAVLVNPANVLIPNTVKTYLRTLEREGVQIVPTRWVTESDLDDLPSGGDLVVKPSIGATGSGLRRFTSSNGLREHVESLLGL